MKNIQIESLVQELKKKAIVEKVAIWKRVATDLEKPSRKRRIVNIYKIDKFAKDNETVIVPGKVLGTGIFNKKITIATYSISEQAKKKLESSGAKVISIEELIEKNPKGKNVRILG
jgi:large subunit ribosomal protein L18e